VEQFQLVERRLGEPVGHRLAHLRGEFSVRPRLLADEVGDEQLLTVGRVGWLCVRGRRDGVRSVVRAVEDDAPTGAQVAAFGEREVLGDARLRAVRRRDAGQRLGRLWVGRDDCRVRGQRLAARFDRHPVIVRVECSDAALTLDSRAGGACSVRELGRDRAYPLSRESDCPLRERLVRVLEDVRRRRQRAVEGDTAVERRDEPLDVLAREASRGEIRFDVLPVSVEERLERPVREFPLKAERVEFVSQRHVAVEHRVDERAGGT